MTPPAPTACAFYGANHIRTMLASKQKPPMSDIGELAADILGDVFRGIYHIEDRELQRVDWADKNCVRVSITRDLATFDGDELTRLVVLAHDRGVRVDLAPRVRFWKLLDPDDFESAVLMPEGWDPYNHHVGTTKRVVEREKYVPSAEGAGRWKKETIEVEEEYKTSAQPVLEIMFHKRERNVAVNDGWDFSRRHPSMEAAMAAVRKTSGSMTYDERREALRARRDRADEQIAEALRAVVN